jgi:hypothetical protein
MINNALLTTVLPVVDVSRAARFYSDQLGFKDRGVETTDNRIMLSGTRAGIALMPAEESSQTAHTVLTLRWTASRGRSASLRAAA